jgi:hypothetical protein
MGLLRTLDLWVIGGCLFMGPARRAVMMTLASCSLPSVPSFY